MYGLRIYCFCSWWRRHLWRWVRTMFLTCRRSSLPPSALPLWSGIAAFVAFRFYHNLDGCDGTTTVDNECLACRAVPDDCAPGFFLHPACTGVEQYDVANCTVCNACQCNTNGGMFYYNNATCGGNHSGCERAKGCPNNCNAHGICNPATGVCDCFDGWGSSTDVAFYKSPDCSQRVCPSGLAWVDVVRTAVPFAPPNYLLGSAIVLFTAMSALHHASRHLLVPHTRMFLSAPATGPVIEALANANVRLLFQGEHVKFPLAWLPLKHTTNE